MSDNTRVIAIGASAGGVDALLRLAADLPPGLTAPVLLVLHIGAHRSQVSELLDRRSSLKAVVATTGMVPRAGCIYVAPSDQHLLYESGALRVFRGPKEHHARPAINPLFRSVALDIGPRAIGVILTGKLDDGAAGLRAIVACGGTAVVQDPADATEPSMPRSALAATSVDHIVDLNEMAHLLTSLALPGKFVKSVSPPSWLRVEHAISLGTSEMPGLTTIGTPSGMTCPDCGGALFELIEGLPPRFLCHTGHAFSLRSLASAHEPLTDAALWSGLRALQEKEAILRRLARAEALEAPGSEEGSLAEAENIQRFVANMRTMVTTAPLDVERDRASLALPAADGEN